MRPRQGAFAVWNCVKLRKETSAFVVDHRDDLYERRERCLVQRRQDQIGSRRALINKEQKEYMDAVEFSVGEIYKQRQKNESVCLSQSAFNH